MELGTRCREGSWICDVIVAGRQGVSADAFARPQEIQVFSLNVFQTSDLPPRDYFVGFRPFSGFASAMTLEMSLSASVSESSRQKLTLEDPVIALR